MEEWFIGIRSRTSYRTFRATRENNYRLAFFEFLMVPHYLCLIFVCNKLLLEKLVILHQLISELSNAYFHPMSDTLFFWNAHYCIHLRNMRKCIWGEPTIAKQCLWIVNGQPTESLGFRWNLVGQAAQWTSGLNVESRWAAQ